MLESEEVDDDYFTPVAKTSLASIFKKPGSSEKSENETLKYSPPLPKPPQTKEEPQRLYENIFSCVFDAYLWLDNVYTHKGKLGCAVVKHNTPEESQNFHSILLYDSKKATVSSAVATKTLLVTAKGKDTISYYDRYGKYWYLRGMQDDVKKIIDALKSCNVNIKVSTEDDNVIPEQNQVEEIKTIASKKIVESDTDSSINKKTKASILNRMASMGQSVLPPRTVSMEPSSDSETNEDQIIAVRHKPVKNNAKKTVSEHQKSEVIKAVVPITQTKDNKSCIGIDNQLQSQSSTSTIASTSGLDLNYFFTEQRINNSELRINVTRISDKVDNILSKINHIEIDKNEGSNVNIIVYQKLLHEYENKIKIYEELLQKVNINPSNIFKEDLPSELTERNRLVAELNSKIIELDNLAKQKDDEISILNNEIKKLNDISSHQNSKEIENELQEKISEYKEVINKNSEMLSRLTTENDELSKSRNEQLEDSVKRIMNDTFRAIDVNFDKNETYSGEMIKYIIGTVIKRVTIESLQDLK